MKSNTPSLLKALLPALVLLASPAVLAEEAVREVSVAALNLPDGSDGLLHLRGTGTETRPLQLSTRYFSERTKIEGTMIHFFKDPVPVKPAEPAPVPLLSLRLPESTRIAYAVLWTATGDDRKTAWKGMVIDAKDWNPGTLKLMNATPETIGIRAGEKDLLLEKGKSLDFASREWPEPFPAKIFRLKPQQKMIFSSTWQVTAGSRELCFVFGSGDGFSLRSVLDLAAPVAPPAP